MVRVGVAQTYGNEKTTHTTMDKCKEIGRIFEMDNTEVEECIKNLHAQTILLFFDKILPNISTSSQFLTKCLLPSLSPTCMVTQNCPVYRIK